MAGFCRICNGLILAAGETLSYSGPYCTGPHPDVGYPVYNDNAALWQLINELATRVRILELNASGEVSDTKSRANTKPVVRKPLRGVRSRK